MENERHVIKYLPIIGVSGNSREEYLPIALKNGMNAYVSSNLIHFYLIHVR